MSNKADAADLAQFVPWGGRPWRRMVAAGMDALGPLEGLRVLEIGGRRGEMSVYFALRGATVTCADMTDQFADGRAMAERHGVTDRVTFVEYDGDPDSLAPQYWDVVFTKSVLSVLRDRHGLYTATGYREFIPALSRRLVPGGRVLLVENAKGPPLSATLRRLRHRRWDSSRAPYFTDAQLRLCQETFETILLKRWVFPPIVTFVGRRTLANVRTEQAA